MLIPETRQTWGKAVWDTVRVALAMAVVGGLVRLLVLVVEGR